VLDNASFVSLPIVPENRRVLFASPEYLNRRGRPASLDDLRLHDCLIYTLGGRPYDSWEFPESPLGPLSIDVAGPLLSNDADMIRRWALAGQGIGYKSLLDVEEDVFSGRLERILPAMKGKLSPLNLICPHRRQLTPAVQKLYAYLREYFQSRNYSRSQEEVVV
jgi:DNA-binding transcriptional LysR family regulator